MKGVLSQHEKERNKKMPTQRHKVFHNPTPTLLLIRRYVAKLILAWKTGGRLERAGLIQLEMSQKIVAVCFQSLDRRG